MQHRHEIAAFLGSLGDTILKQQQAPLDIEIKSDGSKVTNTDLWVHQEVSHFLKSLTPEIPIVSEEGTLPSQDTLRQWPAYWCLDPIDNTHGYTKGSPEFVISLGLIVNQVPTWGWISVPHEHCVYYTTSPSSCAKLHYDKDPSPRPLRPAPQDSRKSEPIPVIMSTHCQDHPEFSDTYAQLQLAYDNRCQAFTCSSALKFCRLLDQDASCYFRLTPTKLWDVAGGFALSRAFGKTIYPLSPAHLHANTPLALETLCLTKIPAFLVG